MRKPGDFVVSIEDQQREKTYDEALDRFYNLVEELAPHVKEAHRLLTSIHDMGVESYISSYHIPTTGARGLSVEDVEDALTTLGLLASAKRWDTDPLYPSEEHDLEPWRDE